MSEKSCKLVILTHMQDIHKHIHSVDTHMFSKRRIYTIKNEEISPKMSRIYFFSPTLLTPIC